MTQERNADTSIKNISDGAKAVSEPRAQKAELKLKGEGLVAQLSQGIHGDGDSAKLAARLAPIQTEILITQAREAAKEKEIEAANRVLLSVCHREAAFVQRIGQEFLRRELATRYPKILALFREWEIPAQIYNSFSIPTGCNGDSLQWCRDLIGELGDFVNRAEHGRDIDAGDLINTIERCRPWFPEPAAAEEITESK